MSLQLLTILSATGGLGLLAMTTHASVVFFMFCALATLAVVSYGLAVLSPRSLGWRRRPFDRVFENETFAVEVDVANRGRLPHFLLTVADTLPSFLESEHPIEFLVPMLWPRERATLSYLVRARKRGVYSLGPLTTSVSDPFGLFQRRASHGETAEAVVYPKPLPLARDLGMAGLEIQGLATGERSRASESGLDFYGIRDYRPGDELRRIHWPATAHHGRLTVIEFEKGSSENLAVVLDTRAGTEYGHGVDTTLEVGVRAAASLVHWALRGEAACCLAVDSGIGPRWVVAERLDMEYEMLEILARAKADGRMDASALVAWAASNLPDAATVVLITAAPDTALPAAIAALRRRQVRVEVVLLDARSFDPRAGHPAETMDLLQAAGAAAVCVRQGDDLRQALESLPIGDTGHHIQG
jgi:uncharacterized protein (DUF58 family)